jgi:hypothetical protein
MQRQVIKLEYDVPVLVKLDRGPEGREHTGQYGINWQYTLNDDAAVMFLPKEGRDAILASGAHAGDTIELLKMQRNKQTLYQAQVVVSDAAEPPEAERAPRLVSSRPNATAHTVRQPAKSYVNGAAPRQQAAPPQPATDPIEDILTELFVRSGRAQGRAYAQLTAEGVEFEHPPKWADTRAAAISLFIDRTRKENGR